MGQDWRERKWGIDGQEEKSEREGKGEGREGITTHMAVNKKTTFRLYTSKVRDATPGREGREEEGE